MHNYVTLGTTLHYLFHRCSIRVLLLHILILIFSLIIL